MKTVVAWIIAAPFVLCSALVMGPIFAIFWALTTVQLQLEQRFDWMVTRRR